MSRALAEARGRRAETLAAWALRLKGYRILARRLRTARGEIDLIARRGKTVAFVEVKARADLDIAAWALEGRRLERVTAAVAALAHRYAGPEDAVRIDAMLVAPGRWPRHLTNIHHAWR
jgi:putative endonuclease